MGTQLKGRPFLLGLMLGEVAHEKQSDMKPSDKYCQKFCNKSRVCMKSYRIRRSILSNVFPARAASAAHPPWKSAPLQSILLQLKGEHWLINKYRNLQKQIQFSLETNIKDFRNKYKRLQKQIQKIEINTFVQKKYKNLWKNKNSSMISQKLSQLASHAWGNANFCGKE